MNKLFVLILSLLYLDFCFAQETINLPVANVKSKYDTIYITDLSKKLGLYINSVTKQNVLKFKDVATGDKLKLHPNGQTDLGIGFNYKWLKLGVAFGVPFFDKDNGKYGETKRLDFQLNVFMRALGVDAYYQKYTGFYLNNPDDYVDSVYSELPNLSDMETITFGLSAYHFFNNRKFSYQAAYVRNTIQKKSAGAFILGGFLNIYSAYSPNGFVPEELPDSIKDNYPFRGFETNILGISTGYTYTYVILKQLFMNASFVPSLGLRFSEIKRKDETEILTPMLTAACTLRFSVGYEGKFFYAGVKSISFISAYNYDVIDISSTTGNLRFYIGKRFNSSLRRRKN
jgi:hypothetical protein